MRGSSPSNLILNKLFFQIIGEAYKKAAIYSYLLLLISFLFFFLKTGEHPFPYQTSILLITIKESALLLILPLFLFQSMNLFLVAIGFCWFVMWIFLIILAIFPSPLKFFIWLWLFFFFYNIVRYREKRKLPLLLYLFWLLWKFCFELFYNFKRNWWKRIFLKMSSLLRGKFFIENKFFRLLTISFVIYKAITSKLRIKKILSSLNILITSFISYFPSTEAVLKDFSLFLKTHEETFIFWFFLYFWIITLVGISFLFLKIWIYYVCENIIFLYLLKTVELVLNFLLTPIYFIMKLLTLWQKQPTFGPLVKQ